MVISMGISDTSKGAACEDSGIARLSSRKMTEGLRASKIEPLEPGSGCESVSG